VTLTIDERIGEDGRSVMTTIDAEGDAAVRVTVGGEVVGFVSREAVERVFERYGKPLADDVAPNGRALMLGPGVVLRMLRHRARYDVLARDFVVLDRPGAPPLAELAITVAGALAHLARAGR